jgi:cytochrome P450
MLSEALDTSVTDSPTEFMIDQINLFCKQLINPATEKVKDMSLWLNYLAYDVMGEIVFARSFNMLTETSLRYILSLIDAMVFATLIGGCMPPLYKTGLINVLFPKIYKDRQKFVEYVVSTVDERVGEKRLDGARKDSFHFLLKARDEEGKPLSRPQLLTEGLLLITGGSETTSTGLAAAVFYLLKHPQCHARLLKELIDNFDNVHEIKSGPKLNSCVYLKACIEETLRMASPGPGILPREILKGGQVIDGEFIPEGMNVGGSWWAIAYNEKSFRDCRTFRPERYLPGEGFTNEEVEQARNSYWPFSMGPRKCPGTKMAYMELYLTIARMVYLFDMTPEKPNELEENFQLLDHFNVKKYGPYVSFKLRDGQSL